LNKDTPHRKDKSLFPDQEAESEDDDSWQVSYLDIITILLGFLVILLSFSELNNGESFSVSELFKSSLNETEFITTPIEDIKEELENLLRPEIAQGKLEIFRDLNDVRIRFKSDDLYSSGSAQLESEASQILNRVLAAFKLVKYDDFEIDVEGHTDNVPISSANFDSNWELSTSRASNIVKYFSEKGIPQDRLKASGYADSRPLVEFDEQGNPYPASKDKNRRVVLRLYYSSPERIARADSISTESENLDESTEENPSALEQENNALVLVDNSINEDVPKDVNEPSVTNDPVNNLTPASSESDTPENNTPPSNNNTVPNNPPSRKIPSVNTSRSKGNFENGCRYSVQVGGFESFTTSLNFSQEAQAKTGVEFEIMYNNSLFSSRTVSKRSLSETISLQSKLEEELDENQVRGFVQQCYENGKNRPQPLKYQIQLAFFQSEQNALSFREMLSEEYGIDAVIDRISPQAYSVLTQPLDDVVVAKQRLETIQSIEVLSAAFIKYDPNTVYDYSFIYQIQLGSFATKDEADVLAERLREEMNIQSSIKTLSSGRYYLVTRPYFDWDEISNLYATFKRDASQLSPVIFLVERV